MQRDAIVEILRAQLKPRRFEHSLGVEKCARQLAVTYGMDADKAALAGLVHDCAKSMSIVELRKYASMSGGNMSADMSEDVLHGPAGAVYAAERFGITDQAVLSAVMWHTVPKLNMSGLDMVVSLADTIEPGRDFKGVDILRAEARNSLESAFCMALAFTMQHLLKKGQVIELGTVREYNRLCAKAEAARQAKKEAMDD